MKITAEELVKQFGRSLIGARVHMPEPAGEVPAGGATVRQIVPDKAAPEIVMQITQDNYGSIGVFYDELVDVPLKKGHKPGSFELTYAPKKPHKKRKA